MKRQTKKTWVITITSICALAGLAITQSTTLAEIDEPPGGASSGTVMIDYVTDGPAVIGDVTKEYSFTPVAPCRIVDTRDVDYAGGPFVPFDERSYFVYGDVTTQGGNELGCPSPVGEPRGVMVNITAVPQKGGQGHLRVYEANTSIPDASIVNYKTGAQSNAASFKTRFSDAVTTDLAVTNMDATTHVIIDVLGYYNAPSSPVIAAFTGGDLIKQLGSNPATIKSISVSTLSSGICVVNASGYFKFHSTSTDSGRCSITTGTGIDFSYLILGHDGGISIETFESWGGTRAFAKSAGTTIYRLVCEQFSGTISVGDINLNAICTQN